MSENANAARGESDRNGKHKPKVAMLLAILVLGGFLATAYWFFFLRNRVVTDDAYVMADSAVVSSRLAGSIARIAVSNDEWVEANDVLVELDPQDYQAVVEKSRAALDRIDAEIRQAAVTVQLTETQTIAQVQAAEAMVQAAQEKEREARHRLEEHAQNRAAAMADFNHAKKDFERYDNLYSEGAGSEQQRDRSSTALKKTKAQSDAMDAQIAAVRATIAASAQEIARAKAQLESARADRMRVDLEKHKLAALQSKRSEILAELKTAELNRSYCTITAPLSGYIAQKRAQVGERVQPGQAILAVIPLKDVYIEANFKETQLEGVRLGQPVEIKADLYPGYTYHGKVAGIRAGTGAAFSLLPPENATGNWIKVVQRIPVKIRLDNAPPPEYPLRVGSSLEVTITTTDKSGPRLAIEKRAPPLDGKS